MIGEETNQEDNNQLASEEASRVAGADSSASSTENPSSAEPNALPKPPKGRKERFREWSWQLISSVLIVALIKWLLFDIYIIPTPSMERNLRVGDLLLVSKLSYGAHTPRTLLQIPLTNGRIWGTNIPSFLNWIQLPSFKLPGFSSVERGEIIVFHYPAETNRPVDVRTFYVKRCVAIAGDSLRITQGALSINGNTTNGYENLQASYLVESTKTLHERVFKALDIAEVQRVNQGYLIHTRLATAQALAKNPVVRSVTPLITPASYVGQGIFPRNERYAWNIDNFGPLVVPYKGMEISLNDSLLALYGPVIAAHEAPNKAHLQVDGLYIEDKKVDTYRFEQDYYFMMGDNRHNSEDSRYWGFVPRNHIVGKPMICLMSFDKEAGLFSKFRWSRFLHLVD